MSKGLFVLITLYPFPILPSSLFPHNERSAQGLL